MNTLIVYDSQFGNTEKIARMIAESLLQFGPARAARVTEASLQDIDSVALLIVGCPTQAWHTTPAMKTFLKQLETANTGHLCFAAFDTRLDKPGWLTGSAANGMAKELRRLEGVFLLKPESFLVTGTEGPLAEGELERAGKWAHALQVAFDNQMEPAAIPAY